MDAIGGTEVRSGSYVVKGVGIGGEEYQFGEELQRTMTGGATPASVSRSSFTALLELPPSQAMELLHSGGPGGESPADLSGNVLNRHRISHQVPYNHALNCSPAFPSNAALIERAAKYSVFANGGAAVHGGGGGGGGVGQDSPESSSPPSNFSGSALKVKSEPADSNSNPNSAQQVSDPTSMDQTEKTTKRKEREKKGKGSSKKSKSAANETFEDGEKLPYVHVRARRGQATDSHSLAERARREKINARMKLLQELVPGCNKISGTALVLDEIINHVQSLQRQVEYLSMRLSAVNPRMEFNLESLLAAGNGDLMDSNYQSMGMPPTWPEIQMNGERQQSQQQWNAQPSTQPVWVREEVHRNLITPESSLLSYDSAHSGKISTSFHALSSKSSICEL